MCSSLFIKLLIIIMMTNVSNTSLDFTKDYLKNVDIENIQIEDNTKLNQNQSIVSNTSYNYGKEEINDSTMYPHSPDSWGDISNNSYIAQYYRKI